MVVSNKEVAPRRRPSPGTRPTERIPTVDTAKSSAHDAQEPRPAHDQRSYRERDCFYCLGGWVFLGSLDYDGGEVIESVRCRRCGGTGKL
jgi:hypothetical protein